MRTQHFHWADAHEYSDTDDARTWLQAMAARGWTAPAWPKEYTGGGLDPEHRAILSQEMSRIKALPPSTGMGLSMIGPTLLEYGTEEQKQRHIPKICDGSIRWCQGYSEPGSGSDLASLQMRADRDGEEWILNGQKVWTSGAQYSDVGEVIARSDFDLPKHQGLTGFMVDMHAPGVEVKPLRQMTGGANFNEVFFTDVRVPDTHRLGDVNQGWGVALTTLMNERASIGSGSGGTGGNYTKLSALL